MLAVAAVVLDAHVPARLILFVPKLQRLPSLNSSNVTNSSIIQSL
jgi:hypothetical protein